MLSVFQLRSVPVVIVLILRSNLMQLVWMVELIGQGLKGLQALPAVL